MDLKSSLTGLVWVLCVFLRSLQGCGSGFLPDFIEGVQGLAASTVTDCSRRMHWSLGSGRSPCLSTSAGLEAERCRLRGDPKRLTLAAKMPLRQAPEIRSFAKSLGKDSMVPKAQSIRTPDSGIKEKHLQTRRMLGCFTGSLRALWGVLRHHGEICDHDRLGGTWCLGVCPATVGVLRVSECRATYRRGLFSQQFCDG